MSEQNISGIDLTLFLNSCGISAARIEKEGAVGHGVIYSVTALRLN